MMSGELVMETNILELYLYGYNAIFFAVTMSDTL